HCAPPLHGLGLLATQALRLSLLETELREQVLAHDHVLQLRGLGEQPPEILAIRDDDLGLKDLPTAGRHERQAYSRPRASRWQLAMSDRRPKPRQDGGNGCK